MIPHFDEFVEAWDRRQRYILELAEQAFAIPSRSLLAMPKRRYAISRRGRPSQIPIGKTSRFWKKSSAARYRGPCPESSGSHRLLRKRARFVARRHAI